jgi:hypothetical protein
MGAKPSRSHWPTVSPRDKMCPTLTCTWSHDERATGSVGERPVSSRTERRWTPSPLNSGRLWASLYGLAKQESDATQARGDECPQTIFAPILHQTDHLAPHQSERMVQNCWPLPRWISSAPNGGAAHDPSRRERPPRPGALYSNSRHAGPPRDSSASTDNPGRSVVANAARLAVAFHRDDAKPRYPKIHVQSRRDPTGPPCCLHIKRR